MLTNFNWVETIYDSPIFMVLVGCSIVTLGIALERVYYFWKRKGDPDAALERALKRLQEGSVAGAAGIWESCDHPAGKAAAQVFESAGRDDEELEERLQITLSQQKLLLERNLGGLGTMAAIAPLIGLLGTVWGIMRAFHDMSLIGSAAPSVVAAGVAEALVTTAAGLVIAVPALMLYNHLSRRIDVMLTVAENHARTLRMALAGKGAGRRRGTGMERSGPEHPDAIEAKSVLETPEVSMVE